MKWKCPRCGREFSRTDQPHYCGKPQTVDEYIDSFDEPVREKLCEIRRIFLEVLPDAQECISWSMPTYRKGRNIIHFAASRKHVGIYPGGEATAVFAKELKEYDTSKGTIRLPYDKPIPAELLKKIALWCYQEYSK